MKPLTLWIIRVALTVQFLGVLAVPALLAASETPKGLSGEAAAIVDSARELLAANAR